MSFLSSFSVGFLLDRLSEHIAEKDSLISLVIFLILVVVTGIFIISDFITGIVASRHDGEPIQSSKWGVTIGKFFGLTLYTVLAALVLLLISNGYLAMTLVFGPVILTILKEYISIGENFEKRFGKKAYMFTVLDRAFDIIEMKFFSVLEKRFFAEPENPGPPAQEEPVQEEEVH